MDRYIMILESFYFATERREAKGERQMEKHAILTKSLAIWLDLRFDKRDLT